MHAHVCVYMRAHRSEDVCGISSLCPQWNPQTEFWWYQALLTNELSHLHSILSFEPSLSLGMGVTNSCKPGQQAPGIPLFPPPHS